MRCSLWVTRQKSTNRASWDKKTVGVGGLGVGSETHAELGEYVIVHNPQRLLLLLPDYLILMLK